jgi:heterodisulfide reductase subunit C
MISLLPNILFALLFIGGIWLFVRNVKKLRRNILLGKEVNRSDQPGERWGNMLRIAFGQQKMVRRPVSGILHIIVYLGFVIINIEMLEIIIDGLLGTHRVLSFLGGFYDFIIAAFEVLALLVIVSVTIFWLRRNILKIQRFIKPEMKGWPKKDANIILYVEAVLMVLFLTMNAADYQLQLAGHYASVGSFPVSSIWSGWMDGWSVSTLVAVERTAWWLHILGVLAFLNYLYYSKHLHILLAFPNTYYAKLSPKGQFPNNETVSKEVALMLDPQADPFAAPPSDEVPPKFGASDVTDLNWVQLLNAYTCTECGRCTAECPANQTGKKLSPRKIMMDTRDRLEEVGKNIDQNKGTFVDDGKQLLDDYITREELWACTTCNACVEACPVSIDPLSIIMDMRQYLVMEQSAAPNELNIAMSNIENNGAPWPYNQMDRLHWKDE